MGTYTELIFGARLKKDTPKEIIDTLKYMCGDLENEPDNYQWKERRNPLQGGSAYFAIHEALSKFWYDNIFGWTLSSRANIKNYEGEIEIFLNWIKPFIEDGSGYNEIYAIVICEEDIKPKFYSLYDDEN